MEHLHAQNLHLSKNSRHLGAYRGNQKVLIIFTLGYEMITIETKLLALISSVGDSPNLTVVNSFYPFSS